MRATRIGMMRNRTRTAAVWVGLTLALAGCADATGMVDNEGHNGYDVMTCETAKALALDIQYRVLKPATAGARISDLTHLATKASDAEVKQATTALISGYTSGNQQAVRAATKSLVTSCEM